MATPGRSSRGFKLQVWECMGLFMLLLNQQMAVSKASSELCSLECQNGSHCIRLHASAHEFRTQMAAGHLVESCSNCPPEYTGAACDIPVVDEDCPETKECDICRAAQDVSSFAHFMCRKPQTEYCSPYDPGSKLSYCTNGGKCKSSYFVEDVDGSRHPDVHKGCVCPEEFEGPSCEFLVSTSKLRSRKSSEPKSGSFFKFMTVAVGVCVLLAAALVVAVRLRRRRRLGVIRARNRSAHHHLDGFGGEADGLAHAYPMPEADEMLESLEGMTDVLMRSDTPSIL